MCTVKIHAPYLQRDTEICGANTVNYIMQSFAAGVLCCARLSPSFPTKFDIDYRVLF
jgi:hypothetical protein